MRIHQVIKKTLMTCVLHMKTFFFYSVSTFPGERFFKYYLAKLKVMVSKQPSKHLKKLKNMKNWKKWKNAPPLRLGPQKNDPGRPRQTQTDSDRLRQAQTDPDRLRQAQTDSDRLTQTQIDSEWHRQTHTDSGRLRPTTTSSLHVVTRSPCSHVVNPYQCPVHNALMLSNHSFP